MQRFFEREIADDWLERRPTLENKAISAKWFHLKVVPILEFWNSEAFSNWWHQPTLEQWIVPTQSDVVVGSEVPITRAGPILLSQGEQEELLRRRCVEDELIRECGHAADSPSSHDACGISGFSIDEDGNWIPEEETP